MKTKQIIRIPFNVLLFLIFLLIFNRASGQMSVGILPVSNSTVGSSVLSAQQWQSLSLQIQEQIAQQLEDIATVKKLSREHILLLMKEVPSPDPENLSIESVKTICKKENLNYILKYSIESIKVDNKNVQMPVHLVILEGNSGKKFWEKSVRVNQIVNSAVNSEHILLIEVFKPSISELLKEAKTLNY